MEIWEAAARPLFKVETRRSYQLHRARKTDMDYHFCVGVQQSRRKHVNQHLQKCWYGCNWLDRPPVPLLSQANHMWVLTWTDWYQSSQLEIHIFTKCFFKQNRFIQHVATILHSAICFSKCLRPLSAQGAPWERYGNCKPQSLYNWNMIIMTTSPCWSQH